MFVSWLMSSIPFSVIVLFNALLILFHVLLLFSTSFSVQEFYNAYSVYKRSS